MKRLEPYSVQMARALRAEASATRGLGRCLLSAEMAGDWEAVRLVRADLVAAALSLEDSARRLDGE